MLGSQAKYWRKTSSGRSRVCLALRNILSGKWLRRRVQANNSLVTVAGFAAAFSGGIGYVCIGSIAR